MTGTATAEEILAEIVELTTPEFRQPGDFTLGEYVEQWIRQNDKRITTTFATRWLNDLVEKGVLVTVKHVYDAGVSRRVTVYRKADQAEKP